MLFFLRERGKDVIKQVCGGADELTGVLFHGWVKRICHRGWGIENGDLRCFGSRHWICHGYKAQRFWKAYFEDDIRDTKNLLTQN